MDTSKTKTHIITYITNNHLDTKLIAVSQISITLLPLNNTQTKKKYKMRKGGSKPQITEEKKKLSNIEVQ